MNSVTKLDIAKMIDHSLLHPTMTDKEALKVFVEMEQP